MEARPVRLNSTPEMTSLLGLEIHQEFGIFVILRQGKVQVRLCLRTSLHCSKEGEKNKRHIFVILGVFHISLSDVSPLPPIYE